MNKKGFFSLCFSTQFIVLIYLIGWPLSISYKYSRSVSKFVILIGFVLTCIISTLAIGWSLDNEFRQKLQFKHMFKVILPTLTIILLVIISIIWVYNFKSRHSSDPILSNYNARTIIFNNADILGLIAGLFLDMGILYFIGKIIDKHLYITKKGTKIIVAQYILPGLFLILCILLYVSDLSLPTRGC